MRDVLVLCYHAVSRSWPAELSVSPQALAAQLGRLVKRGYRGATFAQAVTAPPAPKTLAVTFDDAYRSVLELAWPILSDLGLPGTVFVPTDFPQAGMPMSWPGVDQWLGGPHERELLPMSWSDLRRLTDAGWEVGSHTGSHPRLTQLADDALSDELARSREACRLELGACTSIAYPYGDVDDRVVRHARAAGYRAGAALPAVWHPPQPMRWPRVGIYHADTRWRVGLKVSVPVRGLRGLAGPWLGRSAERSARAATPPGAGSGLD